MTKQTQLPVDTFRCGPSFAPVSTKQSEFSDRMFRYWLVADLRVGETNPILCSDVLLFAGRRSERRNKPNCLVRRSEIVDEALCPGVERPTSRCNRRNRRIPSAWKSGGGIR